MTPRRVALVTGASRGIGAAIAKRLAADGVCVDLTYREREGAARAVCDEIQASGGQARAHKVDVGVEEEVRRLVAALEAQHGAIHILVNNAGMIDDRLIAVTPTEVWERIIRVNLTSAYWLIREIVPLMLDEGWGRIINITSNSVHTPGPGQCAYAASKGGLEALTRATAAEVGHKGIRVNAIAPGAIESEMTAGLRQRLGGNDAAHGWGRPEHVAGLVSFLAGDEADYIQGQLFTVDGGRSTARPRR